MKIASQWLFSAASMMPLYGNTALPTSVSTFTPAALATLCVLEAQAVREVEHVVVRLQDVAVEGAVAGALRLLAKTREERAAEALALPGVRHHERELRRLAVGVRRIAAHGDEMA